MFDKWVSMARHLHWCPTSWIKYLL